MSTFRIGWLLPDTEVSGSVRSQLALSDALSARGHSVTMITSGFPLTWARSRAEWLSVNSFAEVEAGSFDFVVTVSSELLQTAVDLAGARAVHLCRHMQPELAGDDATKHEIERAWRLPIAKLATSAIVADYCRLFTTDVTFIGEIVDESFFRYFDPSEREPLRILLAGAAQKDENRIDDGYGAVTHARWHGASFDLVRVSPWAPSNAEPVGELVQEFHVALTTSEMTRLLHSCDLFLGPASGDEALPLRILESLAAGLPCVLSDTESSRSLDARHDFALFAKDGDAEVLGEKLVELIEDEELRAKLRSRAREVASRFDADAVVERMEGFFEEKHAALSKSTGPRS